MSAQVYISGDRVGIDIDHEDIEDAFKKFGRLNNVWVARQPPGFAFVEFDDSRDAEDAIEDMDGREVRGCRLRVEYSRRKGGGKGGGRFGDRGGSRAPERTEYRVRVTGLPSYTNWRDLKDFLREGGEITYADVGQDGVGVAEFASRRDMEDCIDRLDNTRFRGDRITIEKETRSYDFRRGGYEDSGGRGGSDRYGDRREPSRSRSRSRDRDRDRDRYDDRGRDRDRDDRGRGRRDDDRDKRDDDRDRDRDRDRRDDDRDRDRDRGDGDDDRRKDDDRDRDRRRDDDDRGRDRRRDDDDREDDRDRRRDD